MYNAIVFRYYRDSNYLKINVFGGGGIINLINLKLRYKTFYANRYTFNPNCVNLQLPLGGSARSHLPRNLFEIIQIFQTYMKLLTTKIFKLF